MEFKKQGIFVSGPFAKEKRQRHQKRGDVSNFHRKSKNRKKHSPSEELL